MVKRKNKKKRKVFETIVAVMLMIAIALVGTYAWQSISQEALNEVDGEANGGGRLHDDFDGRNKDIYVENFNENTPIFARIRLDEYMEIGPDAGINRNASSRDATPVVSGADINDKSTWKTHVPTYTDCEPIHSYWSWKMGGETVYMPTFNKNKDSLAPDLNGTYDKNFKDYTKYVLGDTKTDDAFYDADENKIDEGTAGVENVNFTKKNEEHQAKKTLNSTVITMEEWMAQGAPTGPYWVYDTDGWAYWAQAIQPGEATGLLLDGITLTNQPSDRWYYAINAVAQFATAGDWGDEASNTGFFKDHLTDDALLLLYRIAGVRIDNVDFYVLAIDKSANKMLLWSKEMLPRAMAYSPTEQQWNWRDSAVRAYLNGDWLNNHTNIQDRALQTTLTTRPAYDSNTTTFLTTTDKVFLLSEADVYGTFNNGASTAVTNDYTYNGKKLLISEDMRKCNFCTDPSATGTDAYWLRSPAYNPYSIAVSTAKTGSRGAIGYYYVYGLRPALWVTFR